MSQFLTQMSTILIIIQLSITKVLLRATCILIIIKKTYLINNLNLVYFQMFNPVAGILMVLKPAHIVHYIYLIKQSLIFTVGNQNGASRYSSQVKVWHTFGLYPGLWCLE